MARPDFSPSLMEGVIRAGSAIVAQKDRLGHLCRSKEWWIAFFIVSLLELGSSYREGGGRDSSPKRFRDGFAHRS